MKQIGEIINTPAHSSSLISLGIEPEERSLIQRKYAAPFFKDMNSATRLREGQILLVKIHVITGWEIPKDELLGILVDQFLKKIEESYLMINVEEVEYAFRNKPLEVKEWGKAMNISLIDEVLIPYLNKRSVVSRLEEAALPPPVQKNYDLETMMNEHREITEACFQRFKKGDEKYFPTLLMEDILKADGIIGKDETVKYCFKRLIERENIYITGASNSD